MRIFENAVEAEILRTRLDAAGILAVVNGGEVATMLSHIGTAAVRVRVEVAPEDFERAQAILEEDDNDRVERSAWTCSRCQERNEPLFDLCWYCGKQRTDTDLGASDEGEAEDEPTIQEPLAPIDPDETASRTPASDNPYSPPRFTSAGREMPLADSAPSIDSEVEDLVSRVFRGAVIGTVLVPPLLALYVLTQLFFRVPAVAYQSPALRVRLIAAWVLCFLSICCGAIFWNIVYF